MKIRKRRKSRRAKAVKVRTVYKSRPARRRRVKRAVPVMSRIKRRVRRRRSGGGMMSGMTGGRVKNILIKGAVAVGGAAAAVFATNMVLNALGAKVDAKNKKWIYIASALGLGLLIHKTKIARKYATELTLGAVSYAMIQAASTNTDLKQYFNMAGAESEELDQIISNLNVQGELNLLGARETGLLGAREMMGGELNLLGISERLGALDDDGQEEYE